MLAAVAESVEAELTIKQAAPGFLRALLTTPNELLMVGLVHERAAQVHREKREVDGVLVDPLEEILANKLTTAISRQEWRDLVDLYCLERSGLRIEDALEGANAKDGGCTPANLAWLLASFPLPAADRLPHDVTLDDLATWRDELVVRLRRRALPDV